MSDTPRASDDEQSEVLAGRVDNAVEIEGPAPTESWAKNWGTVIVGVAGLLTTFFTGWCAARIASDDKRYEVTFAAKHQAFVTILSDMDQLYALMVSPPVPFMGDQSPAAQAAVTQWGRTREALGRKISADTYAVLPFLQWKDRGDVIVLVERMQDITKRIESDLEKTFSNSPPPTIDDVTKLGADIKTSRETYYYLSQNLGTLLLERLFPESATEPPPPTPTVGADH